MLLPLRQGAAALEIVESRSAGRAPQFSDLGPHHCRADGGRVGGRCRKDHGGSLPDAAILTDHDRRNPCPALRQTGLPASQTCLWLRKRAKAGRASLAKQWIAAAILLAIAGTNGAHAQDYPTRTATVIVPFAAGGPADITGRIVADIFSRYLGQKFVVENAVGAGGTTGTLRAAKAAPDGYTILSGHLGTNALAPAFYPNLGYDPQKDFEPVGLSAEYPELLVARKDFPANNLKEFVAYAKANPEKLNVGHAGLGSVSYIGCLLLHSALGIKPTMIPFTGTAPALNAMLGGQVDYECDPVLGTLRSEEHTSELQSQFHLVCRLLLEKKKKNKHKYKT